MRVMTICQWCHETMDYEKHIITGKSKEHICNDCADKADELGYCSDEL